MFDMVNWRNPSTKQALLGLLEDTYINNPDYTKECLGTARVYAINYVKHVQ